MSVGEERRDAGRKEERASRALKCETFRNMSLLFLDWLSILHFENMRKPHSPPPSFCFHATDMEGVALGLVGIIKMNKIWP